MPRYSITQFYSNYDDLLPIQRGYADALLECHGHCAIGDEWDGIGPQDFSRDVLRQIYIDCEAFLKAAIVIHPEGEDGLMRDIDEHDLGFNFYLDRQRTGVGFRDLSLGELGEHLEECAASFGWVEVMLTPDRRIALPPSPLAPAKLTN